jgi:hypothetical protein
VNDKFLEKYALDKMNEQEKKSIFREIETQYLEFLQAKCNKVMRTKNELQYKVMYYQGYQRYQEHYQREINRLDFSPCTKFNHFSHIVR